MSEKKNLAGFHDNHTTDDVNDGDGGFELEPARCDVRK